jgi:NADPH-dependent curcumin reductase CurA
MSQPWPRDSNETASDQPGAVHPETLLKLFAGENLGKLVLQADV